MVSLATMATIIASQALISGAYSLTAQAIALGYGGRMDITHEHRTCGADLYADAQLAALCRVFGADFYLSVQLASGLSLWPGVSGVMLSTSLAMIPLAVLRWRWSVWRASLLFGGLQGWRACFSWPIPEISGRRLRALAIGLGLFVAMSNYHWGRHALLAKAYAGFAAIRDMRWFLALKQRLIDHGGVLHENTRDLKEAERTDVFMTSRPVTKETDGVPVVLRLSEAAWHRGQKSPPAHH